MRRLSPSFSRACLLDEGSLGIDIGMTRKSTCAGSVPIPRRSPVFATAKVAVDLGTESTAPAASPVFPSSPDGRSSARIGASDRVRRLRSTRRRAPAGRPCHAGSEQVRRREALHPAPSSSRRVSSGRLMAAVNDPHHRWHTRRDRGSIPCVGAGNAKLLVTARSSTTVALSYPGIRRVPRHHEGIAGVIALAGQSQRTSAEGPGPVSSMSRASSKAPEPAFSIRMRPGMPSSSIVIAIQLTNAIRR